MALLHDLFDPYWLEYVSYYIKERAIPHIDDGLKPVQRRILHALQRINDGRFHKVANVVGQTMQFHPHGDQSIYGALINLANKDLFIERQGDFGNIHTGDVAAAARYIECRLTPLAREVLFNKETTSEQLEGILHVPQNTEVWYTSISRDASADLQQSAWLAAGACPHALQ